MLGGHRAIVLPPDLAGDGWLADNELVLGAAARMATRGDEERPANTELTLAPRNGRLHERGLQQIVVNTRRTGKTCTFQRDTRVHFVLHLEDRGHALLTPPVGPAPGTSRPDTAKQRPAERSGSYKGYSTEDTSPGHTDLVDVIGNSRKASPGLCPPVGIDVRFPLRPSKANKETASVPLSTSYTVLPSPFAAEEC